MSPIYVQHLKLLNDKRFKMEDKRFPTSVWEDMNEDDQKYFRNMSEEDLKERWESEQGHDIIKKIIDINLRYGSSLEYSEFLGTVKIDLGKKTPKFDLRGLDLAYYSNLIEDEIFGFDFSNTLLHYSNFQGSFFSSSTFKNSDVMYSNFSSAVLDGCDFSNANLTLSDFSNSLLEYANFSGTWLSSLNLENSDLGYIKYDKKTDFHNIDIHSVKGSSSPLLVSDIKTKQYLKHFKEHSKINKVLYYIWLAISDCGQSFSRWFGISLMICFVFGFGYSFFPESFMYSEERNISWFTFYYYSIVTFTTLGYGEIVPNTIGTEIAIVFEVILGYLMLGGLISIIATKFIPKG